ncbi:MAG: hypothetical protein M1833_006694 [Piccolia ochrophora]|nr:MAG: hypothetical protein M1833_006694 [Piccolia ochrophora]
MWSFINDWLLGLCVSLFFVSSCAFDLNADRAEDVGLVSERPALQRRDYQIPRAIYFGIARPQSSRAWRSKDPRPGSLTILFSDGGEGYVTSVEVVTLPRGQLTHSPVEYRRAFLVTRHLVSELRPQKFSEVGRPLNRPTNREMDRICRSVLGTRHVATKGLDMEVHQLAQGRAPTHYPVILVTDKQLAGISSGGDGSLRRIWTPNPRYEAQHGSFTIMMDLLREIGVRFDRKKLTSELQAIIDEGKAYEAEGIAGSSEINAIIVRERVWHTKSPPEAPNFYDEFWIQPATDYLVTEPLEKASQMWFQSYLNTSKYDLDTLFSDPNGLKDPPAPVAIKRSAMDALADAAANALQELDARDGDLDMLAEEAATFPR